LVVRVEKISVHFAFNPRAIIHVAHHVLKISLTFIRAERFGLALQVGDVY